MSTFLRIGVITCAILLLFGLLLSYLPFGAQPNSLRRFAVETIPLLTQGKLIPGLELPRSRIQFLTGLKSLDPHTFVALGLFLLILLPSMRLVFAVFLFARAKDTTYVIISLTVLTLLILGLHSGLAGS